MKIKVCGLTDSLSIREAARAGVDCVGFVFADSPRRLEPSEAALMAADLPPEIELVAVLRQANLDDVMSVLAHFPADRVQTEPGPGILGTLGRRCLPVLHDGPDLERDSRALPEDLPVLLEAAGRGGRGVRPDWEHARRLSSRRQVFLAGGLNPGNVGEAIRTVRPWGVDVSSGIESSPGVKSKNLILAFVEAVRATESEMIS
jgi:phosphoribosylanthranilate isomerase